MAKQSKGAGQEMVPGKGIQRLSSDVERSRDRELRKLETDAQAATTVAKQREVIVALIGWIKGGK